MWYDKKKEIYEYNPASSNKATPAFIKTKRCANMENSPKMFRFKVLFVLTCRLRLRYFF